MQSSMFLFKIISFTYLEEDNKRWHSEIENAEVTAHQNHQNSCVMGAISNLSLNKVAQI
jgi:hypothetical protein